MDDNEMKEFLKRLQDDRDNKKLDSNIICPYCEHEQDSETMYSHVSYWGEDSKDKISCEECNKDFWVEELVERKFETTTTEWEISEKKRIEKQYQEHIKKKLKGGNIKNE